jgi:hypothetical protein
VRDECLHPAVSGPGSGNRANDRERGFLVFRSGMGRAIRILIFGRYRSDRYEQARQVGRMRDIPTNHYPLFAPVILPTLGSGAEAMVVAARAWLSQ